MNNTQECDLVDTGFASQHHEGHTGYLAINIAYDHIEGWINNTKPDIIMWMLGTDDVAEGRRLADVVEAYTNIVHTATQYKDGTKIIVDTVIPPPANTIPVKRLNGIIPDWPVEQNKTESPIYVNDVYPFPNNLLRDGIHPNEGGDDLIANGLSSLLTWIISSSTTEKLLHLAKRGGKRGEVTRRQRADLQHDMYISIEQYEIYYHVPLFNRRAQVIATRQLY